MLLQETTPSRETEEREENRDPKDPLETLVLKVKQEQLGPMDSQVFKDHQDPQAHLEPQGTQ